MEAIKGFLWYIILSVLFIVVYIIVFKVQHILYLKTKKIDPKLNNIKGHHKYNTSFTQVKQFEDHKHILRENMRINEYEKRYLGKSSNSVFYFFLFILFPIISLPAGLCIGILYFSDKIIGFWLVAFPFFFGLVLSLQIIANQEPKFLFSRTEIFFYKILIGITLIIFLLQLKITDVQLLPIRILCQIVVFVVTIFILLTLIQITTFTKYFVDRSSREFIIIKKAYLLDKSIIKTYTHNDVKNGEIKWIKTGKISQLVLYIYLRDGGTVLINSPNIGSDLHSLAYIALHLAKYLEIPITYPQNYFNKSSIHEISPEIMNEQFTHSKYILKSSEELFSELNNWKIQEEGPNISLIGLKNQRRKITLINSLIDFIFIPFTFFSIISYLVINNSINFNNFFTISGVIILLLIMLFGIMIIYKNIEIRVIKIEPNGIIIGYKILLKTFFEKKWFYDLIEDISIVEKGSNYLIDLKYYISAETLAVFENYDRALVFQNLLIKRALEHF